MDEVTFQLVGGHVRKAREKLETARQLLETGRYDDSVSRSYYCMFHAAHAVLAALGYKSKTHSGLIHLFKRHVTDAGLMPEEYSRWLNFDKDLRENGDYETAISLSEQQAIMVLRHAEDLLKGVETYLREKHEVE